MATCRTPRLTPLTVAQPVMSGAQQWQAVRLAVARDLAIADGIIGLFAPGSGAPAGLGGPARARRLPWHRER
jgi:hypothetical protein